MRPNRGPEKLLVSSEISRAIDSEAQSEWGFNSFSLIEAAGRSCAQVLTGAFPEFFTCRKHSEGPRISIAAGAGNNGADAMVMLRYWILSKLVDPAASAVVLSRMPKNGESGPWVELLESLQRMQVHSLVWSGEMGGEQVSGEFFARADIIIDGIAGTGLKGPLTGASMEMAQAINLCRKKSPASPPCSCGILSLKRPLVVSVDIPSGNSDLWEPGIPVVEADITLAIEPQKYCIYTPAARPFAGLILPVGGIFPQGIMTHHKGAELLNWENTKEDIPKIPPHAYKNSRGTVEIHAGSPGATGAAMIAARGAQAAGAGLIRLIADNDIYPILAAGAGGIMVFPASEEIMSHGGRPDSILLGPGWGREKSREQILGKALDFERDGMPLIIDADAIELVREKSFSGNAILTPHPGEFSRLTGIKKEELLCRPVPALLNYARERKALVLFKGHVITIAAPDGRVGVIDGMLPGLAAGGSGDLLAGFCVAIASRMVQVSHGFDAFTCAAAASALLVSSGGSSKNRFTDPMELADKAADLAGLAWLVPVDQNLTGEYKHGK